MAGVGLARNTSWLSGPISQAILLCLTAAAVFSLMGGFDGHYALAAEPMRILGLTLFSISLWLYRDAPRRLVDRFLKSGGGGKD